MGESAQRRLVRKIDLERFLSKIKPHSSPNAVFEQYTTPESVAATMLYVAAYKYGDIIGKSLLDLGCGTGRLALGAVFLGAESATGIDVDKPVIYAASHNSAMLGLKPKTNWVVGDIGAIKGNFDTVLQNPPFGVQKRAADRRFLEKALQVGTTVYSLHNHPYSDASLLYKVKKCPHAMVQVSPSAFILSLVESHGGKIEAVYALPFLIPHMFEFHTKLKREVVVDLYIIKGPA